MFEVEAAQEGLPGPVDVDAGRGRVAGPQPQRFRGAVAGQVLDLQPDQGAFDDRQLAGVLAPGAAVFQPRVAAMPVGCQNSATASDQRFQAAASYSLIKPPRIGRRRILPRIGSGTGASGRGGRSFSDRCGRRRL